MRKKLKHALIPHKGNNYKPSLFEYTSLSALLALGIIFFVSSVAVNRFVTTTSQGAAVYSSVLVDLTNKARGQNNESTLTLSDRLTNAAQMKADDMANKQYFAHTSPEGITPWYWFQQAGYEFIYAGENLAVDFTESGDVEKAWLASPKHRENIVDPRFTEIGIATKTSFWQGRETTFVVQLFGAPSRVAAAVNAGATQSVDGVNGSSSIGGVNTNNGEVLGDTSGKTVGNTTTKPRVVTVVSETPNTIIAKNESVAVVSLSAEATTSKSTAFQKAFVRVPNISSYALTALSALVLLALLLFVFVEIRRQHPRHVIVGIFVFFVLASLAYASQSLALPI